MNKIIINEKEQNPKPKAGQIWKCFNDDESATVMIVYDHHASDENEICLVELSNGIIWAKYKSLEECIEPNDIFIGENMKIVIRR